MKYKVLTEVEILGEVRTVDTEVEIDAETAAPLIADGKLAEVKEGDEPTPLTIPNTTPNQATPSSETPEPPTSPATPSSETPKNEDTPSEKSKNNWVGNHDINKSGDK